jgi:hypothetical protein
MPHIKLILLSLTITVLSACGGGSSGCSAGFGSAVGGSGLCDKSVTDAAPVAVAGADQSVLIDSTVTLDASNSRADKAGVYVANLVVNDGSKDSNTAFVTITTAEQTAAPVANAGSNQNVKVNTVVTLDGSFSSDANRDPLVYTWKFESMPSGSTATLSSTSAVRPTFTADKAGSYVASLSVFDGALISNFATVTVVASVVNVAPTARIETMVPVAVGKTITLDGSTSNDPDRDPLTYKWVLISQPTGSSEALSSTTVSKPTLVVSKPGNYVASLVVNDGTVNSDYAFITLTAMAAPTAKAVLTNGTIALTGNIASGTALTLDGTGSSDPLNTALTYQWTMTAAPTGNTVQLATPTASKATFTPVLAGEYVITLVVKNGTVDSNTVTLLIKVF